MFNGCNNLRTVKVPANLTLDIVFPVVKPCIWKDSNKKVCTSAHLGLDTPMTYTREGEPKEDAKEDPKEEITTKIAKVTITSAVRNTKKSMKLKWKRLKDVDGYEIQYSNKSNMKKATALKVKKAKTVSKTIKKLSPKKKYYVRIRGYKTVSGEKVYGKWSAKKLVKTK